MKANITGIASIREKIKRMKKEANDALGKRILTRLAEIGITTAEVKFQNAEYDGTNDVELLEPVWINENTIQIVAQGNAVTFIEFGTGVFNVSQGEHPKAVKMGAIRGEYGRKQGKKAFWFYKGDLGTHGQLARNPEMQKRGLVYTRGNEANKCMYETSMLLRSKIIEIIKEEIHK